MLKDTNGHTNHDTIEYNVPSGMPMSVFQDKYARKVGGTYQSYAERAREMIVGNTMLDDKVDSLEVEQLVRYAVSGVVPLSGRHLQHGDETQPNRTIEVFTNCSTAAFSFTSFYLLLNGSGVGRDYSSESCRVNWDYMPNVRIVLDGGSDDSGSVEKGAHPDFAKAICEFQSGFDTKREAMHKYSSESEDVRWIEVRDSREGWTEVIATLETAAFHRNHKDSLFIFDFSKVREAGAPIKGMQNRPAQGPIPLMRAILKVCTIKGAGMKPWKQALYIDHYLASCVAMGDVRRAARMATKYWRDNDIIEFVDIKRGGFLSSANNSVLVDNEFWRQASDRRPSHGRRLFEAIAGAAYYDMTGEPGTINIDLINQNRDGFEEISAKNYINPNCGLKLHPKTFDMIENVLKILKASKCPFITNPCQPDFATVLTPDGVKTFADIEIGSTIWSGKRWTTVINKICTGTKKVYAYKTGSGVFIGTEDHQVISGGARVKARDAKKIDVCPIPHGFSNDFVSVSDSYDEVESVTYLGEHVVFDITVEADEHTYWTGGCLVSNCGEIVLAKFGGYCVIGDVVLRHARSRKDALDAVKLAAKALVRTNLMPALYQSEVDRTNRIGVGLTGIFEYAWTHYKLSFYDLIDSFDYVFRGKRDYTPKSFRFWLDVDLMRQAVMESATEYSLSLGRRPPHTFTTIKPSGTISKVMSCTEGAHLPPYAYYTRWVLVVKGTARHHEYMARGYPIKDVSHQYQGCCVVGFPTKHPIADIVPEDVLVMASDVTVEDQYKWIMLLDHFWLGRDNNQVSYTLKYDPNVVSHDQFMEMLLNWQSKVKCCSIMPFTDGSAYAYLPEEKIDRQTYERLMANIDAAAKEDYDESTLACPIGGCPTESNIN